MSDQALLEAQALIGDDAKRFVESELGQTLIGMARQSKDEAQEKLNKTWSWRRRRIEQLQAEIWRAESFEAWLAELIVQGKQALQQLHGHEE